jgi:hypothetical protein
VRQRISMSFAETLKLIQFRAAYNLPVHAGMETGIFVRHDLRVEMAYTPGSSYISQALEEGRFDIGHTGADDVIAAVETNGSSDLFYLWGYIAGCSAWWARRIAHPLTRCLASPSASMQRQALRPRAGMPASLQRI